MPGLYLLEVEVHDISYILKIRINIFSLSEIMLIVFHSSSPTKILSVSVHDTIGVRKRTVVILTNLNVGLRRSPIV